MSDEATIRQSIQISIGGRNIYRPAAASFKRDVSTAKGPSPGSVTATAGGVDVDLSHLTVPGLCHIINYSTTDYLEYGVYDSSSGVFYPLGEVAAETEYVFEFSRNLFDEFLGTGTSPAASNNKFRVRGGNSVVECCVNAFEK
jgi:hypothetical protein